MDKYTKFRDDRPMCSRVILGKPGDGGCINPVVPTPGKKCLASDEMCFFIRSGLESSISVVGSSLGERSWSWGWGLAGSPG